jgi:hypothetical protein
LPIFDCRLPIAARPRRHAPLQSKIGHRQSAIVYRTTFSVENRRSSIGHRQSAIVYRTTFSVENRQSSSGNRLDQLRLSHPRSQGSKVLADSSQDR